MDPLVALGILAIYVTIALTTYLAGMRTEIWQLREAKTAFHDRYVDKVTQLRGKVEFALLTTIYVDSPKLREIFQWTGSTQPPSKPLAESDRKAVQDEITRITQGLQAVTEPKHLFDQVCADYDSQQNALSSLTSMLLGMSLVVPLVVIGLAVAPDVDPATWGLLAFFIMMVGGAAASIRWLAYKAVRDRRVANERTLIGRVDDKIFAPATQSEDVPPPSPPGGEGR